MDRPQGCLQQQITTPGLKRLQGPRASVSGTRWSHTPCTNESTIVLSRTNYTTGTSFHWARILILLGMIVFWDSNLQ